MSTTTIHDVVGIRQIVPMRRQVLIALGEWFRAHRTSLLIAVPLLVLVGAVHAKGMANFPDWVDDPGTYLSQAWSFQYERALSPYSYFYDHTPAGWMQIGAWSMLTDGFGRHATAIGFGNECMLIAKVISAGLLYVLARRLSISRAGAAAVVLLFGLCPLEPVYGRWTFLDNIVTPWMLLAFVLAYSPRRSISAAIGSTGAFAMAALTKETALILLPAFVWAFAQNLDRRNRAQLVTVAAFCGLLLMVCSTRCTRSTRASCSPRRTGTRCWARHAGSCCSGRAPGRCSTRTAARRRGSVTGCSTTGSCCWAARPRCRSRSSSSGCGRSRSR